jgi:molecular chaperone DnaK
LALKLSRSKFEQLVEDILQKTLDPCHRALTDAGLSSDQIDEVVLVGGSTRIPRVQQIVSEFFKREPHRGVNPDEVVAIGAAVQAGVLGGDVKDVLLLDVTPLSLGIETLGGVSTVLISRNTTIPTRKSEVFSTAADNQTSVEINVVQGERPMARDNKSLGKFHLVGIPAAPRGVPQVEVTFDIDANGILNVNAKDRGTGKEQKITITSSSGLSDGEIENMVRDAESHADEDRQRKEEIEARNRADNMVYSTEKILKENREKISESDAKAVEDALANAKKAIEEGGTERLNKAVEELTQASHKLAQVMYQSAQADQPPGGNASGQAGGPSGDPEQSQEDDEVIDAEYVDVDEKK